jgi:hypothetical protein
MNDKISIIFIFLLFFNMNVYSQKRVSKELIEIDFIGTRLVSATGWSYENSTQKWKSNKNKTPIPYYKVGYNNFKWIQFAKTTKDDVTYYLLIFSSIDGAYKYPRISRDWYSYDRTYTFIIPEQHYFETKNTVDSDSADNTTIKAISSFDESYCNGIIDRKYISLVEANIDKKSKIYSYTSTGFTFNIQTIDNETIARFSLKESDFNANYFEVPNEEFRKLFCGD